jgi:hypothetical protein
VLRAGAAAALHQLSHRASLSPPAIGPATYAARYGVAPDEVLKSAPRLHALLSDGVVELNGTSLAVPEASRILLRGVAAAFDARLDASRRLHSRAV